MKKKEIYKPGDQYCVVGIPKGLSKKERSAFATKITKEIYEKCGDALKNGNAVHIGFMDYDKFVKAKEKE